MPPTTTEKRPSRLLTEYYGTIFFVLVLAFLAAVIFLLKPRLDVVKRTNAATAKTAEQLGQERAYLESLERSIAAAENIPKDVLERVDQALPDDTQIPELLLLFSSVAERDQVKIMNITFAPMQSAGSTKGRVATSTTSELSINLTVQASNYPHIKRFLRDLERSLRVLDIVGINVTTSGTDTQYAIQAKAFVYTPPKKL